MIKVTLESVFIRAETELAWCIDYEGNEGIWLPKSMVESDEELMQGSTGGFDIEIPEWLAYSKELI